MSYCSYAGTVLKLTKNKPLIFPDIYIYMIIHGITHRLLPNPYLMVPLKTTDTLEIVIPMPSFSFSSNSLLPIVRLWISRLDIRKAQRTKETTFTNFRFLNIFYFSLPTCLIRNSASPCITATSPLGYLDIWHAWMLPGLLLWFFHLLSNSSNSHHQFIITFNLAK